MNDDRINGYKGIILKWKVIIINFF